MSNVPLENEIISLGQDLKELESTLVDLQSELVHLPDNHDLHKEYDQFLDELYQEPCSASPVSITGSELMLENDPIAYQEGYKDFTDAFDFTSLEVYTEIENEIEETEFSIESLKEDLDDLQYQLHLEKDQPQ